MFGLDVDTRRNIRRVIAGFPCIEKVLIYGSRAKGNYKVGSDIDLTLIGKDLTLGNSVDPLMSRLGDLNTPYTFDISIFNKLRDLDLIEHVLRVGKTFYQVADSGKWPVVELGRVCEVVPGQTPEGKYRNSDGEGIPFYQGKAEFREEYIGEPRKWASQATRFAEKDDILMSVRAPVGAVNFATQRICIGRGLAAIRGDSNKVNQRYLFFVLKNKRSEISGSAGAAFPSISKKGIERILIPLPHPDIQKEIVVMLNNAFQVIDKAIQNTGQNLKNYQEILDSYLQSFISGKWPVVELGRVCEVVPGQAPEEKYRNSDGEGVPFYQGKAEFREEYIGEPRKWASQATRFAEKDDILMSVRAPVGEVNFATQRICIGRGLAAIRGDSNKVNQRYLFFVLKNRMSEISGSAGAAFPSISKKGIQGILIPLPQLDIQKEIVCSFDAFNEKYSATISLTGQKLANLKNLKESILQQFLNGESAEFSRFD